jgi:hypothetical protein
MENDLEKYSDLKMPRFHQSNVGRAGFPEPSQTKSSERRKRILQSHQTSTRIQKRVLELGMKS